MKNIIAIKDCNIIIKSIAINDWMIVQYCNIIIAIKDKIIVQYCNIIIKSIAIKDGIIVQYCNIIINIIAINKDSYSKKDMKLVLSKMIKQSN